MVNANLKAAAGNIRSATQDKQREIDELRYRLQQRERDVAQDVADKQEAVRESLVEINRIQNDPNRPAEESGDELRHINDLRRAISEKEASLQKERQSASQQISDIEQQISQLNQKAQDLEFSQI